MTGLYVASREALAEALFNEFVTVDDWNSWGDQDEATRSRLLRKADRLIDSGVVKVIDPDDDATVEQIARIVYRMGISEDCECDDAREHAKHIATEILRALVEDQPQPRCQHVSPSPWGPTQCCLPDGHSERHAYSPSESLTEDQT